MIALYFKDRNFVAVPTNHVIFILFESSIAGLDNKTFKDSGMNADKLKMLKVDLLDNSPLIEKIRQVEKIKINDVKILQEKTEKLRLQQERQKREYERQVQKQREELERQRVEQQRERDRIQHEINRMEAYRNNCNIM